MENILICRSSIVVPTTTIKMSYHDMKKVLDRDFTLKYKPVVGYMKTAPQYKLIKNFLILPKASLLQAIKSKLINVSLLKFAEYKTPKEELLGEKLDEEVTVYYPPVPNLFPNQELVCDYLMENVYKNEIRGCVLVAPTGEGKTHMMMGLYSRIGGKMLIVVPNKVILEQTVQVARTAFGTEPVYGRIENDIYSTSLTDTIQDIRPTVTEYYGESKQKSGRIVVGIINTLLAQPPEFFDEFTLVAFDEAPDYCSPEYSQIFWKAQVKNTIAVTATPNDRMDGFDKLLVMHVGKHINVRDIPGFVVTNDEFRFQFNIIKYTGPQEFTQICVNDTLGITQISKMITQLCLDPYRVSLLINRICLHYQNKRHIYVFCERRAYCVLLSNILKVLMPDMTNETNTNDNDFYILMGGVTKQEISVAYGTSADRSIILTTYSYLRRGVSLPRMDTIILATPRRNGLTQVIGRITRRGGNTEVVRIVDDIVDTRTTMSRQLSTRMAAYKLRNGTNNEIKVKYEELEGQLTDLCKSAIDAMNDTIKQEDAQISDPWNSGD